MPSRQALHELQVWMEEMEKALDADANSPIKTLADIEVMLKKYKVSESYSERSLCLMLPL